MRKVKGHSSIQSWADEDRPREKLIAKGRSALTNAELISILIRSGTTRQSAVDLSRSLLQQVDNQLHRLARLSINDLTKIKGIGEAKALSIVSALELGRRKGNESLSLRTQITSSASAYEELKPVLMDQITECFWVLLLNRANHVIARKQISMGGISGTVADPKIIYKTALDHHASSIILAHNHPSGNPKPSEADLRLTHKLKEAGKVLDIPILDHIIFTDYTYTSFADEGLL